MPKAIDSQHAIVPPLENGDELSRDEFERRYTAMPHVRKAELIEGIVYMPSPARFDHHSFPHGILVTWLGVYHANTPGVKFGVEGSVRLDLENEPQPDAVLFIDPACGGQATISDDDYIEGAPELVAEVSASSVSIDLNKKFRAYRRNGVREYLVWRVEDKEIDWFLLRGTNYERLEPESDGIIRSLTYPGLWLDVRSATALDLASVLAMLQRGLSVPEHAQFCTRLS